MELKLSLRNKTVTANLKSGTAHVSLTVFMVENITVQQVQMQQCNHSTE